MLLHPPPTYPPLTPPAAADQPGVVIRDAGPPGPRLLLPILPSAGQVQRDALASPAGPDLPDLPLAAGVADERAGGGGGWACGGWLGLKKVGPGN